MEVRWQLCHGGASCTAPVVKTAQQHLPNRPPTWLRVVKIAVIKSSVVGVIKQTMHTVILIDAVLRLEQRGLEMGNGTHIEG